MGPPKLYMTEISPCVRAVLLTARVLDLTLELREVDLRKKQHITTSFLKLNPQHTVPTLEDNGYVIWDSHAIIAYLVGKYGMDDSLYPRDLNKRAVIDQRLHFDSSILQTFMKNILNPILYDDIPFTGVCSKQEKSINHAYALLEKFLSQTKWVAGSSLTIADLSLLASVTSLDIVIPINPDKYPRIIQWIKRAETCNFYVANENGLNKLKTVIGVNVR